MNTLVALLFVGFFAFASGQSLLYSGSAAYTYVYAESYSYFYFTPTMGFSVNATSVDPAKPVFLLAAQGYYPTIYSYDYASLTYNQTQMLVLPQNSVNGSWYLTVYGYTATTYSYFYITALNGGGNAPLMVNGVPKNGTLNAGLSTNFTITIPANTFDVSIIALTTSGDPDQFLYNSTGFLVTSQQSSVVGSSCMVLSLPVAGTYTYVLKAYGTSFSSGFNYTTAYYLNHQQSCSMNGNIVETATPLVSDVEKMNENEKAKSNKKQQRKHKVHKFKGPFQLKL